MVQIFACQDDIERRGIGRIVMGDPRGGEFMVYFPRYILIPGEELEHRTDPVEVAIIQYRKSAPGGIAAEIPCVARSAVHLMTALPAVIGGGVAGHQRPPHAGGVHDEPVGAGHGPAVAGIEILIRTADAELAIEERSRIGHCCLINCFGIKHGPAVGAHRFGETCGRNRHHHIGGTARLQTEGDGAGHDEPFTRSCLVACNGPVGAHHRDEIPRLVLRHHCVKPCVPAIADGTGYLFGVGPHEPEVAFE